MALDAMIEAARRAGALLLERQADLGRVAVEEKGLNDYVSEVDRAAEQAIIAELRGKFPHHAILAEESGHHGGSEEFQWVIDPLDGTTNYLHGFPHFAVSIAQLYRGQLEHAVIYDPLREDLFTATRGSGAQLNDRRIRVSKLSGLEDALLGTGLPYRDHRNVDAYLGMLKSLLAKSAGIRRPGSAALDFAYVAAGRIDGFWELGLAPWDIAAGALLVREAGGAVSDVAGGDRFLETGNVVAAGLKVHAAMLKEIAAHLGNELTA